MGYLDNTHLIPVYIEAMDYDELYEYLIDEEGDPKLYIFSRESYIQTEILKSREYEDEDERDISIEEILSDNFFIMLSTDDILSFIGMVENSKSIVCDLNKEKNKRISFLISDVKEQNKYTENYILDNLDEDYKSLKISTLSKLPTYLFAKYPDKFDWVKISFLDLPLDFIEENEGNLEWDIISTRDINEEVLEKFPHRLNIPSVLENLYPQDLIREYKINKVLND